VIYPVDCVIRQARVLQKVGNAIHRINQYPADSLVCFVNIHPLDGNLSGGSSERYPAIEYPRSRGFS